MPTLGQISVPQYEISLGGTKVSPKVEDDILNIVLNDDIKIPAMLSLTLNLWNFQQRELNEEYLTQFKIGTPIEFSVGLDDLAEVFTGEVVGLEPEFGGDDRGDLLHIQAFNRLHRLRFGTYQRTFSKVSASDIASTIASDSGLTISSDDSKVKHTHVTQNNKNNLQFLLELAESINYEVLVEDKTLFFRETQEEEGQALTVNYRQELYEFKPRQKALPQGAEVEVRGWDIKTKGPIVSMAGSGDENSKMGGDKTGAAVSAQAFGSVKRTITNQQVMDADEAKNIAKAIYNNQQSKFIEADGECVGDVLVRAGKTIEILGVGEAFSGIYYITSASHTFGEDGYITTFKVRRNAI